MFSDSTTKRHLIHFSAVILVIDGQLTQQVGGDIDFAFQSNSADTVFECVLLEGSVPNIRPPISPCENQLLLAEAITSGLEEIACIFSPRSWEY